MKSGNKTSLPLHSSGDDVSNAWGRCSTSLIPRPSVWYTHARGLAKGLSGNEISALPGISSYCAVARMWLSWFSCAIYILGQASEPHTSGTTFQRYVHVSLLVAIYGKF